ncbi:MULTISPECIES: DUF6116 family protein [unclassified Niveibacterium]|uniref:DUF6116 family protein n=1 Tax=unclassified Niveibacterium TaxID=2648924 RepID=UPI001552F034|nr:DUF6116 family protein [Niveibacterium sp. COAC-50]
MAIPGFFLRLLPGALLRFAERLRFPQLFLLTLALFVFDLLIPDFIPFVDELLLALGTLLLGSIRKRREPDAPTTER